MRTSTAMGALLLVLSAAASAQAETVDRHCFLNTKDRDGDGYAAVGSSGVTKSVTGLACPSGYVNRAEDCDDTNKYIHPRRWEDAYNNSNGIDDDCDGAIDEPEPVYPSDIYRYTYTSGFWVPVRLNLVTLLNHAYGTLYARVRYKDLSYDDGFHTGPRMKVTTISSDGIYQGFVPGHAGGSFRAYIRFYDANDTFLASSDTFNAMLDPSSSVQRNVDWARYYIVNEAMHDLLRAQHGELGYRGTVKVDGTNYGAPVNGKWCSEFYAHTADLELDGVANLTKAKDLSAYFDGYILGFFGPRLPGGWYSGSSRAPFRDAKPGDYLAIYPDADAVANHSGMVIAYDAYNDRLQTIEGNSNNDVVADTRKLDSELKGYGAIQAWMLD